MKKLLAMLMFCALARAENYQFLVLVDGSQSMASREASAARKVRELVRGGFQGQAMPGDILDVWAFTSELKTNRFVTQVWNASNYLAQAELAGRFVETEKFVGRTRFKSFADELNSWIARQPSALVFIVTDGEDPIVGLPNDLEINSYISPRKGAARTARRTFLVGFKVQGGKVTEWMAHDGLGPAQLPRLPEREAVRPAAAAVETKPEPEPPKPAPEPVLTPVLDLPPGSVVVTSLPAAQTAEPPRKEETTPPETIPVIEPTRPAEPEPAPVEPPEATRAEGASMIEAPAAVEKEASKPAPAVERAVNASTNDVAPATVAINVQARKGSLYYLMGGGVAVLLLALLLLRKPSGEKASIISKSLSQK